MTTDSNFEAAKLRYHTAHVAFAKIDGQVIDASATLEELREKHAAAADELNAAREGLVQARSPVRAAPETRSELEFKIGDPAYMDLIEDSVRTLAPEELSAWLHDNDRERTRLKTIIRWHNAGPLATRAMAIFEKARLPFDGPAVAEPGSPNGSAVDRETVDAAISF